MRIWTIQSYETWRNLKEKGILTGDLNFINEDFKAPYQWMAAQMRKRTVLSSENKSGESYPLWAWFQYNGVRHKRPDLRNSTHLPKGTRGVLIEFEIEKEKVLLSDFDLWHYVLNYWYLPFSVMEAENFEKELERLDMCYYEQKPLPVNKYHRKIEESWEKIFDLQWENKEITCKNEEKIIQATFWELKLDQVKSIKEFTAK